MILEKEREVQYVTYIIQENESFDDVCKKFSVPAHNVVLENSDVMAGDRLLIRIQYGTFHIVKPAETLGSIAKLYGVSVQQLCEKNKIKAVFVGQQIII